MSKHTLLSAQEFVTRRATLLSTLPANTILIVAGASEITRSNDTDYPFCQNKNFYYLTGFNEPDALLVLIKGEQANENQSVLFSRAKDPFQEIWHGRRIGQLQAQQEYLFDQCFTLDELDRLLPNYIDGKNEIHYCHDEHSKLAEKIAAWIATVKSTSRQGGRAPNVFIDCAATIHEMRLFKSEAELSIMRQVNLISGNAHQRAMEKTEVGKFEYQIEADILHEFARLGARYPAYGTIVAGGDNANVLHYTDNADVLKDNELLLIDAGGELAGYAADITRTFPINGRFTEPQKRIYQLVLDVQELAINAIKPKMTFAKLNALCCDFLTKGLFELDILSGDLPTLINEKACKKYFIHGLGHWLGLDVHDVGDYQANAKKDQLRPFEIGMVMTIEPGIYIPLDDTEVDPKWRGIGVRIEDNIVVTAQGFENLTVNAPKSIDAIEALMAKKH